MGVIPQKPLNRFVSDTAFWMQTEALILRA
jgi:hypothetical protein